VTPAYSLSKAAAFSLTQSLRMLLADPLSASMADSWRNGPAKALERQNAALAAEPLMS
jgi:hypothetical protein